MARLTAFALATSILCADVARAQPQAAVQDLGNGMHAAIGVAVGAGLESRLEILKILDRQSGNSNERGWLQAGILDAETRLKR